MLNMASPKRIAPVNALADQSGAGCGRSQAGSPPGYPYALRVFCSVAAIALCGLLSLAPMRLSADQSDPRLPAFQNLLGAADMSAAAAAEGEIWQLWLDAGSPEINLKVRDGIETMNAGHLEEAISIFGTIVEQSPNYAEGWNKRATAYYVAEQFDKSMADIQRTLILEPRHFGAISGMGLIFLRLGDERGALRAFQEVLRIYPRSPSANANVRALSAKLDEKRA